MKIRKFRKEDARKVSYLIRKAQKEVLSKCYSKKIINNFNKRNSPDKIIEKSKEIDYFLAVEGDKILGIGGLRRDEVKKFYVNPRYHKQGVGRKIIENIEKIAKKKGIKKLKVKSSLYADGFYKKCGFKRIKRAVRRVEDIKFPEILMEKRLG